MNSTTYPQMLQRYHDLSQELEKSETCSLFQKESLNAPILLAVSKQQSQAKINSLLHAGHRFFAENRVQEAYAHWDAIKSDYPDLELHLIGPLQSNKIRDAVALFDVIQTIDSEKRALGISNEALEQQKHQRCMIQVNIGREPQKHGVLPEQLPVLLHYCQSLPSMMIEGLMCVPPADQDATPYFAQMQQWQAEYALPHLSMGMSGIILWHSIMVPPISELVPHFLVQENRDRASSAMTIIRNLR